MTMNAIEWSRGDASVTGAAPTTGTEDRRRDPKGGRGMTGPMAEGRQR